MLKWVAIAAAIALVLVVLALRWLWRELVTNKEGGWGD